MADHFFLPEGRPAQVSPVEWGYFDGREQIPFLESYSQGLMVARAVLAEHHPEYTDSPVARFVIDSALTSELTLNTQRLNTAEEHYRATHDKVTGLLNVAGLDEVIERTRTKKMGVILVDPTNLKKINDKISYDEGTGFLIDLANLLESCTRYGDYAARIGGDEFMILFDLEPKSNHRRKGDLTERQKLQAAHDRLAEGTTVLLKSKPRLKRLGVEVAIGIAFRGPTSTIESLKKSAERDMKRAKAEQHARVGKYRV